MPGSARLSAADMMEAAGTYKQEITRLWKRIVTLTRERDEVRAENTRLRQELDEVLEREREGRGWQG